MSLDIVKSVFQNLNNGNNWSLQLLNITTSKRTGTSYSSRQIILSPPERFTKLLTDISNIYTGNGKKSLDLIREVREYDGTTDALTIYKLDASNDLISSEYENFVQQIADPDSENDPFEYTSAYLITGQLTTNDEDFLIKLVSMQNPVTTLKHKFLHNKGTFVELTDKVLSLRPTMDLLIVNSTVYFLTLSGENLFNMARSYKAVCQQKVTAIEQADIISGFDEFKVVAGSGHNPRRFVGFSESRLTALKRKNTRLSMSKQFNIPLDATGEKFDASVEGAAEKIVKLLCKKGMVDPFEKNAGEVDGARQWR